MDLGFFLKEAKETESGSRLDTEHGREEGGGLAPEFLASVTVVPDIGKTRRSFGEGGGCFVEFKEI